MRGHPEGIVFYVVLVTFRGDKTCFELTSLVLVLPSGTGQHLHFREPCTAVRGFDVPRPHIRPS